MFQVDIIALSELCVLSCTIVLLRTIFDNNAEFEFSVQCGCMLDRYGSSLCNSLQQSLLVNLLVSQLIKKCLPVYGTCRFVTVFTTARHFSLT